MIISVIKAIEKAINAVVRQANIVLLVDVFKTEILRLHKNIKNTAANCQKKDLKEIHKLIGS